MNMPMLKEGADWPGRAIAGVVGIIASGIVAIMVNGYNSQGATIANQQRERENAIEASVRADELTIAELKISAANTATEVSRTEGSVAAIESTLQGLKSASDAHTNTLDTIKDQFSDIQKKFAEWDNVWRPLRTPGGH